MNAIQNDLNGNKRVEGASEESMSLGDPGAQLAFRRWRSVDVAPRAILLIVPGFKSHAGRYDWAGTMLARDGFVVYALDLRGRGHSDGERFVVRDFQEYVDDVEAVASAVRLKEAHLPLYVVGHSAGAVVAMLYVLQQGAKVAGVVSLSIAQELPAPGVVLSAFKLLSNVAPHAPVLKLKSEDFTRDQREVAAMNADAMIAQEVEPLETVAALVRGGERLHSEIRQLAVPVLFVHGKADHAARPSGSEHLYATAGTSDKQIIEYEAMLHEPLADQGREVVIADLKTWLDAHLGSSSARR
jgi:acylglycerol lipase